MREITCVRCNGSGKIVAKEVGKETEIKLPCPDCFGHGKLLAFTRKPKK